jgi:hypothetical protein
MLYSQKLRLLASWLEDHPEIDERQDSYYDYPSVYIHAEDTSDFGSLCKAMGKFEKERSSWSDSISAVHQPRTDDGYIFQVTVSVSGVCQKVPRLDEDGTPIVRRTTKTVPVEIREEVVEEPEYDWKCPESWLSL